MRRFLAVLLFLAPAAAQAEVPLAGSFAATAACPATVSISKQTNPGRLATVPGQSYLVLAGNQPDPTHYRIVLPGHAKDPRWVAATCGTLNGQAPMAAPAVTPKTTFAPRSAGTYVLAVNWQPAFCETRPQKSECRTQGASRYDASHLSLHGLWPEPRGNEFCGVSADDIANSDGDWRALPQIDLSTGLRNRLDQVMPGTRSLLERHEWIRHGTCYGTTAERYFSNSVKLMDQLNASLVVKIFADNVGATLTLRDIRQAFDQAFGRGAGQRVSMDCEDDGGRRLISEVTINLTGDPGSDQLAQLIAAAQPAGRSCSAGIVDPVGQQ